MADTTVASYGCRMALTALCTTCQRTVYVEKDDTPVCPVCSSPLLETVEAAESDDGANDATSAQTSDAK